MKKSDKSAFSKNKIRNDIILAAVILIIAVAGLLFVKLTKTQGNTVVVKIDGVKAVEYSLEEDVRYEIKTGKNNEDINVLVIKDGKASITEADCPDGICKDYRPISYVGETIVCLPHKVVVEITGDATDISLDAVV
ncbi:MAG: NusG domain II-containing protein [Clostridia bacterium]|nr:NusG domain II-containing protein [Clostridia bacterium]